MSRKLMVAGNWKMNKEMMDAFTLATEVITPSMKLSGEVEIVLSPPAIYLHAINSMRSNCPQCKLAAQNCHFEESGAYTGEVSASMLASVGVDYVIIGHSERREYFAEDHQMLADKVKAVLAAGLKVIFCCGEPLEVRESGDYNNYIAKQLEESLFFLSEEELAQVVIAYEPIWAIGTGKTASPEQAQEVHAFIRMLLAEKYTGQVAQSTTILYGGSCKPTNAAQLFVMADVDGALVGGASLKSADFMEIIAARSTKVEKV